MAAAAQLYGRLKAHRLQILPTGGVFDHDDTVIVTKDDPRSLEDAADRGMELARYFRLR